MGTWKEMFATSQLKRDILPQLKAPGTVPDIDVYARHLQRIWLDHKRQWGNRKMHPLENMPDYGREITNIVSDVALLVLLDDPQQERETLLLRYVDRWWQEEAKASPLAKAMWEVYRSDADTIGTRVQKEINH